MAGFPSIAGASEKDRPTNSPCLSDEDVLAFASGRLAISRLPEAHLHFDECEICQHLLSEAAHALANAPDGEDGGWNTMFRPGSLVGGRYLIRQFIARGGMGEVYEAFDRELQERVALKTVTSTASDSPKAVRLLKGEVQLARRVSHPNVCRIYDFGSHVMPQTGAQISFLTMEFVEGETLGQRVRFGGALPIAVARKLGRQLLQGLSAAHDAGVLHRDFKSDNVMLRSEAGAEISPLILDFGLARALDQESRAGGSSGNPTLLGTFGYIAPEQLEARPHSKASDVYAFGIVWFEMLTGELPFESSSSPALAVLERLKRDAPAPSSRNPQVPRDLDEIVLGCLRKSPTDRYRTAGEVLAALDAIDSRARPPISRRKLITLAGAIVLGGVSAYWALSTPPKSLPPVAAMAIFSSASQTPAVAALPQGLASAAAPKGAASAGSLLSEAAGHRVPNEMLALKPAGSRTHRPTPDPPQAQQQPAPVASLATAAPPIAVPTTKSPAWEDPFSQHSADGG